MTIGYRNADGFPPDMFGMCIGLRVQQNIYVHYRLYAVSEIPRDQDMMMRWIYDRYVEKDQLLAYFNKHGHFPALRDGVEINAQSQAIKCNWYYILLIQGFLLLSTVLHYRYVILPLWILFF